MKFVLSLVSSCLILASTSFARPMVAVDVIDESQKVEAMIGTIEEYQSKFWAIGLNGDTLKPDSILKFFQDRDLDFKFFVRSMTGVSTGEMTAYEDNIKVLADYKSKIIQDELTELDRIAKELAVYQKSSLALGLNGTTKEPDQFLKYFSDHNLPFELYIQEEFVSVGNSTAYESNLAALEDYRVKLNEEISTKVPVQSQNPLMGHQESGAESSVR